MVPQILAISPFSLLYDAVVSKKRNDDRLQALCMSSLKKSGVIKITGGKPQQERDFNRSVWTVCVFSCVLVTLWDSNRNSPRQEYWSTLLKLSPEPYISCTEGGFLTTEPPEKLVLCKTANGWREAKCSLERVTAWSMGQWDTALEKAEYALKNLGEMAWKCQVGRGSKTESWRDQNPFPSARWTDSPCPPASPAPQPHLARSVSLSTQPWH